MGLTLYLLAASAIAWAIVKGLAEPEPDRYRGIAEDLTSRVELLLYVRAMESPSVSPTEARDRFVVWLESYLRTALGRGHP